MKTRRLTQSELARQVGVSRQAVSLWVREPDREEIGLRDRHLVRLARVLRASAERLARPLPCCEPETRRGLLATYLWDRLFDDLDDFVIAVHRRDPRAVARLVQVCGLYATARMVGEWVWDAFDGFQRHIHPARRRQLETLARWHRSRRAA